jgi:diguanylate cyclase (GGDEF)-like protein
LRATVEATEFVFQADRIHVTISVGCALLTDDIRNAAELLTRSDEKLYEAKNAGRNKVCA